jgi:UDP-MurNAc hydroxylase
MANTTSLTFINHASVLISHGEISLLSDPWYQGDAFHKGWSLIHELTDDEISGLLERVSHIWISHEHPDHFSIMFFKKFGRKIKDSEITIIFQETSDKRVENFLSKSDFSLDIISFDSWKKLSADFEILCFKDGFYDSGLAIKTSDKTILNLNDCEINSHGRCEEVLNLTGECDILLSQFSYAAWKGGKENLAWRQIAAKEKIETLKLQARYFKPKVLVPFASYVYFSNTLNYYLNDSSNKPSDVIEAFVDHDTVIKIMAPFEMLNDLHSKVNNLKGLEFWDDARINLNSKEVKQYDVVDLIKIQQSFEDYQTRVFKNNTKWFIKLIKHFSPIAAFRPVIIRILDLGLVVKLDLFSDSLQLCTLDSDLSMSSESLYFMLNNSFGFDTLTVNGCFEEERESGFSKAARSLSIENLNNMGIEFRPNIIFNFKVLSMFFSRLLLVSKKVKLSKRIK